MIRTFRVGGCVRDELLGVKSKDIDLAVEAESFAEMLSFVEATCKKVFLVTEDFFTVRAMHETLGAVDFVLCRKDSATSDGRRPEFVEAGTILDDLARRDFTINAMAVCQETGEFLDPHNGREALRAGVLDFVGSANQRLDEDALRAFRALRFSITRGFRIGSDAKDAIRGLSLGHFHSVSADRVRDELFKCFAHDTGKTLDLLTGEFRVLLDVMLDRGIKLEPTTGKLGVK